MGEYILLGGIFLVFAGVSAWYLLACKKKGKLNWVRIVITVILCLALTAGTFVAAILGIIIFALRSIGKG